MNKNDMTSKESERLAREQKESEIKARVLGLLPELPYYTGVHGFGYKCDGWVKLTVNNGTQLLEVYKALPPVELVKHSDSCTSFFPLDKLTNLEQESGDDQRISFPFHSGRVHS